MSNLLEELKNEYEQAAPQREAAKISGEQARLSLIESARLEKEKYDELYDYACEAAKVKSDLKVNGSGSVIYIRCHDFKRKTSRQLDLTIKSIHNIELHFHERKESWLGEKQKSVRVLKEGSDVTLNLFSQSLGWILFRNRAPFTLKSTFRESIEESVKELIWLVISIVGTVIAIIILLYFIVLILQYFR